MAYDVRFSLAAEQDEDLIVSYLVNELHSKQSAINFLNELENIVGILENYPLTFPAAREERLEKAGYRKAPVMRYLAIYRVTGATVFIVRIFHASQDYAKLL